MPPGNVVDPWLAGRRFGIVVDAGSSGSRLQIYSWTDPRLVQSEKGTRIPNSLPKVDKGTKDGEGWVSRIQPGISSHADDPETVALHLAPLLNHARETIPPSLHHETPLFLLATAGMRLLSPRNKQHSCFIHVISYDIIRTFALKNNLRLDHVERASALSLVKKRDFLAG
ncbi:Golgi apyrase [Pleurotus ostreatus]|nr:Golgi apyrase [Pleurotus ostreatus]